MPKNDNRAQFIVLAGTSAANDAIGEHERDTLNVTMTELPNNRDHGPDHGPEGEGEPLPAGHAIAIDPAAYEGEAELLKSSDGGVTIETEELPDGVRIPIPPPGMGTWNRYGWVWLIVGNGLIISTAISGMIVQHSFSGSLNQWMTAGMWAAVGILILIGLLLVDTGLAYLIGRHAIELRGASLLIKRHSGLIRFARRIPLMRIHRLRVALTVDAGNHDEIEHAAAPLAKNTNYSLVAELESGGKRPLAQWMTYSYVCSLAITLAAAIEQHYIARGVEVEPPTVKIDANAVECAVDDTVDRTLPETSDITIDERDGEVSIVVPKLPLLRGKGGQSVAGTLLGALGAAAVGLFIFSGMSWMWLFFLAPAAATWGKFVFDRIGERETYIDLVNDTLLVSHASFRGIKQYRWTRDRIKAIRCGKSDMEINDEKLPQLEVFAIDSDLPEDTAVKKHGFLVGRSRDELMWVAWRLRQSLSVPNSVPSDDENDEDGKDAVGEEAVFGL